MLICKRIDAYLYYAQSIDINAYENIEIVYITSLNAFFHIYFLFETYLFSMVHMEQIGYTVSHCDKSFL